MNYSPNNTKKLVGENAKMTGNYQSPAVICSSGSTKFFLLRLLSFSINISYSHVWNTVVMFGLVLLVATWNG